MPTYRILVQNSRAKVRWDAGSSVIQRMLHAKRYALIYLFISTNDIKQVTAAFPWPAYELGTVQAGVAFYWWLNLLSNS
jgi:hypothetical protein